MIYFSMAVVLAYYFIFLLYFKKLFPPARSHWVIMALSILGILATYLLMGDPKIRWINLPIIILTMSAALRFTTSMTTLQAIFGGNLSVMSAYCFRGIITGIYAFSVLDEQIDILYDTNSYYIINMTALPLALLTFALLRRIALSSRQLRLVMSYKDQLTPIVAYEITAVINLIVIGQGRLLLLHAQWYTEVAFFAFVLTLGMLIYMVVHSAQLIELLDYKWRTALLEEQYTRQIRHYKAYEKYTNSFRTFRHDFAAMMGSLKALIRGNENEKAIGLIDDMYNTMQKKVKMHKKYSNHVVLDAVLQDVANLCEENEIRFSFQVVVPLNTGISLLDAIRVFSNLTNNAVEACLKVPPSERFIEVSSSNDSEWSTLYVINSFNAQEYRPGSKLVTTKQDKENHGLGLTIVHDIIRSMGGLVVQKVDPEKKIFAMRVHIPRHQPEATPPTPEAPPRPKEED